MSEIKMPWDGTCPENASWDFLVWLETFTKGCPIRDDLCDYLIESHTEAILYGHSQQSGEVEALQSRLNQAKRIVTKLINLKEKYRKDLADLEATFDLQWKASRRAVQMWRDAGGDALTIPDRADLIVWVMQQLAAKDAEIERLKEQLLTQSRDFCETICAQRAEIERLKGELAKENAERVVLWGRLYAGRELWCDFLDDESIALAQSEADTHGVPVTINIHGSARYTVKPKEITALQADKRELVEGLRDAFRDHPHPACCVCDLCERVHALIAKHGETK